MTEASIKHGNFDSLAQITGSVSLLPRGQNARFRAGGRGEFALAT